MTCLPLEEIQRGFLLLARRQAVEQQFMKPFDPGRHPPWRLRFHALRQLRSLAGHELAVEQEQRLRHHIREPPPRAVDAQLGCVEHLQHRHRLRAAVQQVDAPAHHLRRVGRRHLAVGCDCHRDGRSEHVEPQHPAAREHGVAHGLCVEPLQRHPPEQFVLGVGLHPSVIRLRLLAEGG